jgi:hypothetical protein
MLKMLPLDGGRDTSWDVKVERRRRRHRLATICESESCPHRGTLWPSWLRIVSPVQFEGRLYCDVSCLLPALASRVQKLQAGFVDGKRKPNRMPLGLILLQRGVLSQAQLREALKVQRESGRGRIGYWLRELGMVDESSLTAALGQQYGCPVFPLERMPSLVGLNDLVPLSLLESSCVVPAHSASDTGVLYLAFGDRVDRSTLFAIEQMLGRRTVGCVARETAVNEVLERFRRIGARDEIRFDSVREPGEMTETIGNYARELQADRIAVMNTSTFIWARFQCGPSTRDLLFRMQR